jgi:hypothetical protein
MGTKGAVAYLNIWAVECFNDLRMTWHFLNCYTSKDAALTCVEIERRASLKFGLMPKKYRLVKYSPSGRPQEVK